MHFLDDSLLPENQPTLVITDERQSGGGPLQSDRDAGPAKLPTGTAGSYALGIPHAF